MVVYTWNHEGEVGKTRMLGRERFLVLRRCPDANGVRTARGSEVLSRTCSLKKAGDSSIWGHQGLPLR